jgi:alpha-1,3-glucosyltransferase
MAAAGVGRYALSSILFSMSLNHKQMSLYYALAFFGCMLGISLHQPGAALKLRKLACIAATVGCTFGLTWLPFLSCLSDAMTVVRRIFPTQRGLFEDYVANFWWVTGARAWKASVLCGCSNPSSPLCRCVSSLVFKWKQRASATQLLKLCALATLCGILPSTLMQAAKPTNRGLVIACLNSALTFFMFSYQVCPIVRTSYGVTVLIFLFFTRTGA